MPPSQYDIPVDDPKLLAAVAYLEALGAPPPKIERQVEDYPGGEYAFTTCTFGAFAEIAVLMIMAPNMTANWLGEEGVMPVHKGLSDVAPIPTVSAPSVATPKIVYLSPIGARQEATPEAVGDFYWNNPGWSFPNGQVWKQKEDGKEFLLHVTPSMFAGAPSVYWERTK